MKKAYSFLFGKGIAQSMKTYKEICGDSKTPNKYVRFESATLPKLGRKHDGAILRNAIELGDPRVYIYASHTYGDGLYQISVYTTEGLAMSFYMAGRPLVVNQTLSSATRKVNHVLRCFR